MRTVDGRRILLGDPLPVVGLFGKHAQVAEGGPLQLQHQRPVGDGPRARAARGGRSTRPARASVRSNRASACGQAAGSARTIRSAAGQGRSSVTSPKRSSRRPSPKSSSWY